jgi:hypothetical protein
VDVELIVHVDDTNLDHSLGALLFRTYLGRHQALHIDELIRHVPRPCEDIIGALWVIPGVAAGVGFVLVGEHVDRIGGDLLVHNLLVAP